jgi:hypothetical protein
MKKNKIARDLQSTTRNQNGGITNTVVYKLPLLGTRMAGGGWRLRKATHRSHEPHRKLLERGKVGMSYFELAKCLICLLKAKKEA